MWYNTGIIKKGGVTMMTKNRTDFHGYHYDTNLEDVTSPEKIVSKHEDKHGTLHIKYAGKCHRCGGAGGSDKWKFTGWTCFHCNGNGTELKQAKIYTEARAESLAKIRKAREEKKTAERIRLNEEALQGKLEKLNLHEPTIKVITGNTFEIRHELKEKGATFSGELKTWYFTGSSEAATAYETTELPSHIMYEVTEYRGLALNTRAEIEAHEEYQQAVKREDAPELEWIGSVKGRLEIEVKLNKVVEFETEWGTLAIHLMEDRDGNKLVWKTTSRNLAEEDETPEDFFKVKATVKEHSRYKDTPQTILTRVKVL
jgi:hypothetical protein